MKKDRVVTTRQARLPGLKVRHPNNRFAADGTIPGDPMSRQIIRTKNAAKSPPTYSQAVKAAGLVFVSGTGPHDPETGAISGETIQEQTNACLTNISAILSAAGSSLSKILSATVILAEESDFAGMNEE